MITGFGNKSMSGSGGGGSSSSIQNAAGTVWMDTENASYSGQCAFKSTQTGTDNIAQFIDGAGDPVLQIDGRGALSNNSYLYAYVLSSEQSVFIGTDSNHTNVSGSNNSCMGYAAGDAFTTGSNNSLFGHLSGYQITSGGQNSMFGKSAGEDLTSGGNNTGIGYVCLASVTTTSFNTAVGSFALQYLTGQHNVAMGYSAGNDSRGNNNNTYIGSLAGFTNRGNSCIFIGYRAGSYQQSSTRYIIIDPLDRGSEAAELTDSMVAGRANTDADENWLRINAKLETKGINRSITAITDDYTAKKVDHIIETDASSNTILVEFPEPDTDYHGQEYVIDPHDRSNTTRVVSFNPTSLDVDTITDQGGNTFRYTMNNTPDLSGVSVGDYIKVENATNAANDGIWVVTAVSDPSDYIEITNAAGVAESSDSPATLKLQVMMYQMDSSDKYKFVGSSTRITYKIFKYIS